MRPLLPLVALALVGCKKVEPAPKDLDALMHLFFAEHDEADDERMAEAFRNLDAEVKGASLDEHWTGGLTNLSRDEVQGLGPAGADPANATGILLVNRIDCTMAQMIELVTAPNQKELYATYDEYDRSYSSDIAAFKAGDEDSGSWEEAFTVTILGITYEADTLGSARRIPELDEEQSPFGATLLTRRTMPEPARFDNDRDSYPQDYRAEVYYPMKGGVVHLAAMWREASFAGFDSANEGIKTSVLKGMKDWDDLSAEHCAGMR